MLVTIGRLRRLRVKINCELIGTYPGCQRYLFFSFARSGETAKRKKENDAWHPE